jgi:hypothetical protein
MFLKGNDKQARILQYNFWARNGSDISGTRIEAQDFLNKNSTQQQNDIQALYGK